MKNTLLNGDKTCDQFELLNCKYKLCGKTSYV